MTRNELILISYIITGSIKPELKECHDRTDYNGILGCLALARMQGRLDALEMVINGHKMWDTEHDTPKCRKMLDDLSKKYPNDDDGLCEQLKTEMDAVSDRLTKCVGDYLKTHKEYM